MCADKFALLCHGENQFIVHEQEAARSFRVFERVDFALSKERDQWAGVRGRGEDIHKGQFLAQFFRAAHADHTAHQINDQVGIFFLKRRK